MVYTVTLNPSLDYRLRAETLQFDTVNRATEESITFGGKGINVSAVLRELGVATTALGFKAGFTGEKLEELLHERGIKTDFCTVEGMTRINVKLRADRELDINATGITVTEEHIQALLDKIPTLIGGSVMVLSGAAPKGVGNDVYARIMERAQKRGMNVAVDAEGDLLRNTLPLHPWVVKPNHEELGALYGVKIETEDDIIHYASKMQSEGAINVLVSWAEKGAILLDSRERIHRMPPVPGTLADSTGCGDSMLAGYIAGVTAKGIIEYGVILATACGAAAAFTQGLPTFDEILKYKKRW